MSRFSKYNKSQFETIDWGFDASTLPFIKRDELTPNKAYKVKGLYISKDNGYGPGCVACLENARVNLNKSMLDSVKDILASEEDVQAIKNGELEIMITPYDNKKNGKRCYMAKFL